MTSSSSLLARLHDTRYRLGNYYDHYMIDAASRQCHPDYEATLLSDDPHGYQICTRRAEYIKPPIKRRTADGRYASLSSVLIKNNINRDMNSFETTGVAERKTRKDLYAPDDREPIQIANPYNYSDRHVAGRDDLKKRGLLYHEEFQSGPGFGTAHAMKPYHRR